MCERDFQKQGFRIRKKDIGSFDEDFNSSLNDNNFVQTNQKRNLFNLDRKRSFEEKSLIISFAAIPFLSLFLKI